MPSLMKPGRIPQLTQAQVDEIRNLRNTEPTPTYESIAIQYGVSVKTVWQYCNDPSKEGR